MRKNLTVFALIITVLALTGTANAHGTGKSITKIIGDYAMELEYESLELRAEEPTRMNFSIRWVDPAGKPDLKFTDVRVSIIEVNTKGGFDPTVFAGQISQANLGPTGMTYVFPRGGVYEVAVRFENSDKQIAESSFEMTVANDPEPMNAITTVIGGLIGLLVGALGLYLIMKNRT